jgi:hypothetical protein
MKAGIHQTDSLPCIVIVGGGRGLGDAAEPGPEDGEVNIRRLHLSKLLTRSPRRQTMKDWLESSVKRKAGKQSPKTNLGEPDEQCIPSVS